MGFFHHSIMENQLSQSGSTHEILVYTTQHLLTISIIVQVIAMMCLLQFVENYLTSYHNHPTCGDYNTAAALIFKMAVT